jgi:hypothetical protein
MPDDVSPDVDQRTIDDLITQMMQRGQPALPEQQMPQYAGPTPEFLARNPRAATSMGMQQGRTLSESIPPLTQDPRGPQRYYRGPDRPSIYPTAPQPWQPPTTPGAVKIGPNGEIIIPE